MKLLRGLVAELPELHFRAQQTEEQIRPDLCGFDGHHPLVLIENKFWAGLTERQPVAYLQRLAEEEAATVLLIVGPAARIETLWREVGRRSTEAGVVFSERSPPPGVAHTANTGTGPVLAVTSWTHLLTTLEREAVADDDARSDLTQIRALCHAADAEAFVPLSGEELTDQRTPLLILQLGGIVNDVVERSVSDGWISVARLRATASWNRLGRYIRFLPGEGPSSPW